MERFVEGNRSQQMKLAKAPWSGEKILRKGAKQLLWIAFALWTGFTFVGYFTPISELAGSVAHFATGPWETFWVLFYGGATYVNAGFMREQVCKYMCPYARFQSAMFDTRHADHHLRRQARRAARRAQEGRRPRRRRASATASTARVCVQVCPTGIDIRKGLQYECIACAACIDACDEVMDKVGYPRGLIRYDTQHGLEGKAKHVLRPRTIVYATLLTLLVDRLRLHDHPPQRRRRRHHPRPQRALPRAPRRPHRERLQRQDPEQGRPGPRIRDHRAAACPASRSITAGRTVWVGAGQVQGVPVRIRIPEDALEGGADIQVAIAATDEPELARAARRASLRRPTTDNLRR